MHTLLFEFRAMGGPCSFHLRGDDDAQMERAAGQAIAEVRRIETKFSRYLDDSVVSRINRAAGMHAVTVDVETRQLLAFADQLWWQSGGLFDITSGVLRRAWNFSAAQLPTAQRLSEALSLIGWDRVQIDGDQVRLANAGMEIDFGGFGKEYAADRAAVVLREAGVSTALINLGGDLHALGDAAAASGSPWSIQIQHPRPPAADPMGSIAHVSLTQGGLATSGDYERFIHIDGRRYCHILHPRTGWPISHHQSISVLAPNATAAGALTTIAMLKEEDATAWLDTQGVSYLAVRHDGQIQSNAPQFQLAVTPPSTVITTPLP